MNRLKNIRNADPTFAYRDLRPTGPEYDFEPVDPVEFPISIVGLIGLEDTAVAQGDIETIERAARDIRRQGWCYVNIDPRSQKKIQDPPGANATLSKKFFGTIKLVLSDYEEFFSRSDEDKLRYSCIEHFGYNSTDVREGMRVLTGLHGQTFDAPAMFTTVQFDNWMMDIMHTLSPVLFGCPAHDALTRTNSCLAPKKMDEASVGRMHPWERSRFDVGEHGAIRNWDRDRAIGFGMLDIVRYFNDPSRNVENLEQNVPGHIDPGILSFSMTSSERGLELFDPVENAWIECPLNVGVLWCGAAANELNPDVPPGRHRVAFSDRPRIAMWYEICAEHQVPREVRQNGLVLLTEQPMPVVVAESGGDDGEDTFSIFIRSTAKSKDVQSKRIVLEGLKSSTTMSQVLAMFEYKTGNPLSKSRPMKRHRATLFGIESGQAIYDRDATLAECGLNDGDSVFMDWD